MKTYDYIVSGAGCAGLSLLMRIIESGKFSDKRILLIDQTEKLHNDRTWCFWEEVDGYFENVVHKYWEKLWIHTPGYSTLRNISPYRYKMIRGIDFYNYCFSVIRQQKNIDFLWSKIEGIDSTEHEAIVQLKGQQISAEYIFNSIPLEPPASSSKDHHLLQHFLGFTIETDQPTFDPEEATLMDFRISQELGTAFVYIMPFTDRLALVEYTLFSASLLKRDIYHRALQDYISANLAIENYRILDSEYGVIPMSSGTYKTREKQIFNIGTAGGQTKASSGYTFQNIQKHSETILHKLTAGILPDVAPPARRFKLYDRIFLDVMMNQSERSQQIFSQLFSRNSVEDIFNFLDSKSSLAQDWRIIRSLPSTPFLKAAMKQLL